MNLSENIRERLLVGLNRDESASKESLNNALRLLAKWRSVLIQNTLIKNHGVTVQGGPFKGLNFIESSSEGCHIAKLLGCYEQPLHKFIDDIIGNGYESVINIGCAEGYYAVGLAVAIPNIKSYAYDTDEHARKSCRELAHKNGVGERVIVGDKFTHSDFRRHNNENAIVFCDIEGAELDLLDPGMCPEIKGLDILVEAHECIRPGIVKLLRERFCESHEIEVIEDSGFRDLKMLPSWFKQLAHLDQLLAVWEWRTGPTPWMLLKSKH